MKKLILILLMDQVMKVDYLIVSDGVFSNTKSVIENKIFKPIYYGAIAIRTQIKNQDISNFNTQ